jgi:hypothetical protein
MQVLQPLIPEPLAIEAAGYSGRLSAYQDPAGRLLFRFVFNEAEKTSPLRITVKASSALHHFCLHLRDTANSIVMTPLFYPAFDVKNGIELVHITPLLFRAACVGNAKARALVSVRKARRRQNRVSLYLYLYALPSDRARRRFRNARRPRGG